MKVAFLGLGKMGLAMASNLQQQGFPLTVWNRSPEKGRVLARLGACVAPTPRAAVEGADVIVTSLADDASVEAVMCGIDGVLMGLRPGAVHVGTSTVSPAMAERLAEMHAEHGSSYVSAPVLGRLPAAQAGQLISIVSGQPDAVEVARPVIAGYAPVIVPAGVRASQASTVKLIANFLGAAGMDLIGQSIALAERSGVAPELVRHMLLTFFGAEATRDYVDKIAARDFETVGFTVEGGLKDVDLMIDAAHEAGLDLSSARTLKHKLEEAVARGWTAKDWSCFTDIDRLG